MEPTYSVLLFSKYSANCKKILSLIEQYKLVNILGEKLQFLCLDNENVRNRIKKNKQIDINVVPCVLSIFSNGGVEKYDGTHAFDWITNIISKLNIPTQDLKPSKPQIEEPVNKNISIPKRMKPVEQYENKNLSETQENIQRTSIDDIPYEDDEEDMIKSRHMNKPPPKRIRQDKDKYVEDENLFPDIPNDNEKEQKNAINRSPQTKKNLSDSNGIRAKADALAKGRDDIEKEINKRNSAKV